MSKFYSDTLEEGIQILHFQSDESKYPEGVEKITQAVNAGEPDAYYFLARCYAWEDGDVAENKQKARELSKEGILKGSNLCVLGADRFSGLTGDVKAAMQGTLEDAFHGVTRQAEAGNPMAQYAVALFYFWQDISSLQQPKSPEEYNKNQKENTLTSLKWYKLAAEQGCIPAFRNHYACLANGSNGAPHDLKAAMQFVENVKNHVDIPLAFYYEFVDNYEELEQPKNRLYWLENGAVKGDSQCCTTLGLMYLGGDGVKEDENKALKLFHQSAELGNEYGIHNLGRCYYNGWGVEEDNDQAFQYFNEAAEKGVAASQRLLAECYQYGYGTEINYEKCFSWSLKALGNGNTAAGYLVGKCYLYGEGVPQNTVEAKKYLEQNAENGGSGSMFLLGQMYDQALGVPEDVDMAVSYYQKAIEGGDDEAEEALAHFKKSIIGGWKRR